MPDYRFATIGPTEAASSAQWALFVADPFGDGSVQWVQTIVVGTEEGGEGQEVQVDAPGVETYRFLDDDGRIRYDVRLSGPRADDDIALQFRTNGVSGSRLTQRRYAGTSYHSATLTTREWRNIILITGVGSEVDGEGLPSQWPPELREHTWL